jgi:hypothetical protein
MCLLEKGINAMNNLYMRTLLLIAPSTIVAATAFNPAHAQDNLIYVAVEPCRIVDTRKGNGLPIEKNEHMNFLVSGTDIELLNQGGSQAGGCAGPKPEQTPAAIAAYVIAVPAESSVSNGVLTAYPSDQPQPAVGSASTVNFAQDQVIGNTTNITLCTADDCPADGQFAILSRSTDEHVVVDVLGYFYPLPGGGYQIVFGIGAGGSPGSLQQGFAQCPVGKRVTGGGYDFLIEGTEVIASYPIEEGRTWTVKFKSQGETPLRVYAICENAFL